jgi:hypothetical protein
MSSKTRSRLAWSIGSALVALCWWWFDPFIHILDARRGTVHAQEMLKDFEMAIKNYQVEYNRLPLLRDTQKNGQDQRTESTGKLMACLLGNNVDRMNPREISYIEPPVTRDGRGGLVEDSRGKDQRLMDPWGHPYLIVMDTNGTHTITNPDLKNTSARISKGAPATLSASVRAYSRGPDGIEGTEDDVVSWRDQIPGYRAVWSLSIQLLVVKGMLLLVIGIGCCQFLLLLWNAVVSAYSQRACLPRPPKT